MKLVLVRPPFYALFGVSAPKMKTYPLSLLYLATYVRATQRHEAVIVDGDNIPAVGFSFPEIPERDPELVMNARIPSMVEIMEDPENFIWRELEAHILAEEPDLVGITCNSGNLDAARLITARLKRHGLPIILGGSHVTALPVQSIRYVGADMSVRGEGERAVIATLDALAEGKDLSKIPSLTWRDGSAIFMNARGPLIESLDGLPIPDRSLIDRAQYYGDVIMTGRGCPFECAYCASRTIWGRTVRLRSIESIIAELSALHKDAQTSTSRPGHWVVKVLDDTFTVNRKRTLALLEAIVAEGLNRFEFTGGVRADTLDEEVVGMLREANFRRVTLGVESGSPRILRMIHKGESNEDVTRAVALLRRAGIHSHAFFMIGLPGEQREDIDLSKQLILEARPDHVEINMVTPYPGTEIFDKLITEDPDQIDRWYRWFHQGLATHSSTLGYDLDEAYRDFVAFAQEYHAGRA
jgi:anaerobic magnesium-protoporphyrin IX monomethyl ester cyclase